MFRLAALVVAPYERPWLFPHAVKIVNDVIARKVVYDAVDERELCNLRYLNLLRERIELAIRGGEAGSGLLPVLDQYEPVSSTDGIAFSTAKPCEPTEKREG